MGEQRNVGIIVAILFAAGGLVLVQGGGGNPKSSTAVSRTVVASAAEATPALATCALDAPCVAADYFSGDGPGADPLWRDHCGDMQFLIALVPDPVDAHIGWLFDPIIESIERAAEASHYSLDRFALPWDEGAAKKAACKEDGDGTDHGDGTDGGDSAGVAAPKSACGARSAHEFMPGMLLFRKTGDDQTAANSPLAVLLVGETPTGGVHKHALHAALTRIAECKADSIAILGPTFSGSTRSLSLALREWWGEHATWSHANLAWRTMQPISGEGCEVACGDDVEPEPVASTDASVVTPSPANECTVTPPCCNSPIRIISGTATSVALPELRAVGRGPDGGDAVSFSATVLPDEFVLGTFVDRYLGRERGIDPGRVALLVEANSAYGQSVRDGGGVRKADDSGDAATARPTGSPEAGTPEATPEATPTAKVLTLLFPMHIGEARSAIDKARAGRQPEGTGMPAARPDLGVVLDDGHLAHDLPPQMFPGMSGPAAEFALANLLATISRNEIKYVGLIASDTRDKLFLAKQVRKYCPDVRLFTLESDLLYAHPDNREALAGMLVASTYPLFNRTQAWTTSPDATRLQFSSSAAEGVYNAALILLDYNAEWVMADYAKPRAWQLFENRRTRQRRTVVKLEPQLWITAVGNSGLWPLQRYAADSAARSYAWTQHTPLTEEAQQDKAFRGERSERGSARSALLVWAVLTLACLFEALRYYAANRRLDSRRAGTSQWRTRIAVALRDAFGWFAADLYRPRKAHRAEQRVYVIICFAALGIAYFYWSDPFIRKPESLWQSGPVFSVADGRQPSDASLLGVGRVMGDIQLDITRPIIFGSLFALGAVVLGALFGPLFRRGAVLRRSVGLPWCAAPFAAFAILFAAIPLLSAFGLMPGCGVSDMITFERVTNLESQLSPLVPCLLVAAAWFLLARGQLVRLELLERPVENILCARDSRGTVLAAAGRAATRAITHPWTRPLTVGAGLAWLVPCALLLRAFLPTYESWWFNWIFSLGFFVASVGVVTALAQSLTLWGEVHRLLDRLAAHPLAGAFARQPPRLQQRVRESLFAYAPNMVDLEFAVEALRGLQSGLRQLLDKLPTEDARNVTYSSGENAPAPAPSPPGFAAMEQQLTHLRRQAEHQLTRAATVDSAQCAVAHCRKARAHLDSAAKALVVDLLTPLWDGAMSPPPDAAAWVAKAEEFVAAQTTGYIGYFFEHARNLMFFATGGLVLLLLTVPSYPFQPQRLLNMFVWVLVLAAVACVVGALMQMNRSDVLTNLTGSQQKDRSFDRTLLSPLLKYGALPLFSLVATQFPGIGETVFSWVEPLLRAMK